MAMVGEARTDTSPRLLAVLGASGSGKSSVVRAGLMPALARPQMAGPFQLRTLTMVPTADPLASLATALERAISHIHEEEPKLERSQDMERTLRQTDLANPNVLSSVVRLHFPSEWRFVLCIDQFEELFSPTNDEKQKADRNMFIANIMHACSETSGRVSVVITLRTDFQPASALYPDLNAAISANSEIVPVMSHDELLAAIARPAANAGAPLDPATVSLLLEQSEGNSAPLPLLQFALEQIWEGIRAGASGGATLSQIGGVAGAVGKSADEIYQALKARNPSDGDRRQAIARRAFLSMVQLNEGARDTRRRARLAEF